MQVYNNPDKVQVTFQNHLASLIEKQSRRDSKPQNIHVQKQHPNVVFDMPASKNIEKINDSQKLQHLPKKVSFHYSNTNQQQHQLHYPPNPPENSKNKIQIQNARRFSQYSKKSNQLMPNAQYRNRINSTDHKSNISKESKGSIKQQQNISTLGGDKTDKRRRSKIFANQQINKKYARQQTNVQYNFSRERTDSGISSKSSTKIIIQTVRQVNPDGTKGAPVQQKHRVQTQYLTTQSNIRQNYHINEVSAPKHIIVNHNFHGLQNANNNPVNNYYSPQNQIRYIDRPTQVNNRYIPQNFNTNINHQNFNTNITPHNFNTNITPQAFNTSIIQKSKESTAEKAKYSDVFTYPVRNSGDQHYFQYQQGKNQTKFMNSLDPIQQAFPITSQSKFQYPSPQKKQYQDRYLFQQLKEDKILQTSLPQSSENLGSKLINIKQSTYRGYGADLLKDNIVFEQKKMKSYKNKQYFNTNEFYSISQKLIDEIFRNQTQKAVLKLKAIENNYSPRKCFSPNPMSYRHFGSIQRKQRIAKHNYEMDRVGYKKQVANQQMEILTNAQETLKI